MRCTLCRKQFKQDEKIWWAHKGYCPECKSKKEPGWTLSTRDTYCIICGNIIKKTKRRFGLDGFLVISTHKRYCEKCKASRVEPKPRRCIVCDDRITTRAHKFCDNCKPHKQQPYKANPVANRRASTKWAKNNPGKVQASILARQHPGLVKTVYECACESKKKVNHHFDYTQPYEVLRLCPACHSKEHTRLRLLEQGQAGQQKKPEQTPQVLDHTHSGETGQGTRF